MSSKQKRRTSIKDNLQVYAFWTGFASTIISLLQVLLIALRP